MGCPRRTTLLTRRTLSRRRGGPQLHRSGVVTLMTRVPASCLALDPGECKMGPRARTGGAASCTGRRIRSRTASANGSALPGTHVEVEAGLDDQPWPAGTRVTRGGCRPEPQVLPRTTRWVGSIRPGCAAPDVRVASSSSATISRPICSGDWCTVVSGGCVDSAIGASSKPTTATSSGTCRPASRSALQGADGHQVVGAEDRVDLGAAGEQGRASRPRRWPG